MSFLYTLLAFVVALGSLIVFHELGHYWVARLCGVKVLRFSVGMGKVVWSRRFGPDQTEWAVSALPLGGYVKMLDAREQELGALAPADLKREFTRQSVWRRIAIVAAGPAANFILAIALFAGLYMHGIAEPSSRVGAVPAGTPAAVAGLQKGDMVSAVNGHPVAVWSELRWQLIQAAIDKEGARLQVERPGSGHLSATLPAAALASLDLEGDVLGKAGITLARPAPVLGQVLAGGAAERAGLRSGDLILSVDARPVEDGAAFVAAVRAAPGRALQVGVRRAGADLSLAVTPEAETAAAVTVGKIKAEVAQQPDMIVVAAAPLAATGKAVAKVWETSALTLKMMGKMITGQASWKNVTGPITIADYAGQTARIGAVSYLSFIAFISVSLGVMNLLPIPVLDGGLLLYYSLEVLTGRPVPERFGEIARRLGVGLLLTLMALAVFNDVARLLH
ncbi:RIP metalloprotease RseP [Janthinobacterium sp.]|uniref:RIP metalloprotease RseP n=1 Tax=Janthinobacterium sp. TaxID=1871054 RepID=UPI00293D1F79|nr:RIP metalloprotease RseP [Janthinobacterium sp.]